MTFTKRLRDGVRRGEITVSIRIWKSPRVIAGNRYRMEEGEIEIDSIEPIGFPDITPQLAVASGFLGVLDLLKVAKHGSGDNIYLIRFHYVPPRFKKPSRRNCLATVSPHQHRPAVHVEDLARTEPRQRRTQKHHRPGDLIHVPRPAEGNRRLDPRPCRGVPPLPPRSSPSPPIPALRSSHKSPWPRVP